MSHRRTNRFGEVVSLSLRSLPLLFQRPKLDKATMNRGYTASDEITGLSLLFHRSRAIVNDSRR